MIWFCFLPAPLQVYVYRLWGLVTVSVQRIDRTTPPVRSAVHVRPLFEDPLETVPSRSHFCAQAARRPPQRNMHELRNPRLNQQLRTAGARSRESLVITCLSFDWHLLPSHEVMTATSEILASTSLKSCAILTTKRKTCLSLLGNLTSVNRILVHSHIFDYRRFSWRG